MKAERRERTHDGIAQQEVSPGAFAQHGQDRETWGEEVLLNLLKQGDSDSLLHIKRKYHEKLYSVAYGICKNHEDAEEVLQDVYVTAVQKIDQFEERSRLSTWLYRITVNASLMKRRSQHHARSLVSMDSVAPILSQEDNVFLFDGGVRSQEDLLMVRQLCRKIREIAGSLPEIYQEVFSLRDLQGYSIEETSRILNATPATIKSRLHRGRFFIKEELRRYLADN